MSKLTIALIAVFLLVCGAYFYVKSQAPNFGVLQPVSPFIPQPTSLSSSSLSLSPSPLNAVSGTQTSVSIMIDSQDDLVRLVQVEIGFDPKVITDISITPGNYFLNPAVVLSTINYHSGRISYALTTDEPHAKTNGTVAVLSFTPHFSSLQSETSLYFLPKTVVRDQNGRNSLRTTYATKILPLVNTPASPGASLR